LLIFHAGEIIPPCERVAQLANFKAPSANIQAPEKLQTNKLQTADVTIGLEIEIWSFSGCWRLVLGALPKYSFLTERR
jgi:hypothetical protein